MRKLVIISHTDHQRDPEKGFVGWGPTVKEINHLAGHFDAIEHVACLEDSPPRGGSLPYTDDRITLRPIPTFGGKTLAAKLSVISGMPRVMRAVRAALKDATHVQLRLPMGIGLYLLPFFALERSRSYVFWVKYANDWGQRRPPLGYALQRWMLKRNIAGCKVTINGFWDGQQPHCISFENPCLRESEIGLGREAMARKVYTRPYTLAFVGRLEDAKGVSRILSALRETDLDDVAKIHFMGDGKDIGEYRRQAAFLGDRAEFHGFCSSDKVREVLASAHFLLLPTTASEGFPKVVAEAACFGCIPVVSDVGSIPHYVKEGVNGFVWRTAEGPFEPVLGRVLQADAQTLRTVAEKGTDLSALFTFERYVDRLETKIFPD